LKGAAQDEFVRAGEPREKGGGKKVGGKKRGKHEFTRTPQQRGAWLKKKPNSLRMRGKGGENKGGSSALLLFEVVFVCPHIARLSHIGDSPIYI